jgi:tetratricopeptide (TPR) repeat protein
MRVLITLMALAVVGVAPVAAADPLAEARRLYNLEQYDAAARLARDAMKVPATMESGRLVLGRIHLERFRRTADPVDLVQAREALKAVNASAIEKRERTELTIGLGEALFLDDKFGAASELFERALDTSATLGSDAHERVLDWWASALERMATTRPRETREPIYARVIARMEKELAIDPTSPSGSYWLAAAARGSGNLERAWHAAIAGWVIGMLARDRGAALRADLDRLMVQGIIPDRAARLQPRDAKLAGSVMLAEWEALKAGWSK